MKRILFVFGTRPEAIKMAPLIKEMQRYPEYFLVSICVTGQHREMLYQVLDFFSITPDFDLQVMRENQTLSGVTSLILERLEPVLEEVKPDIVIVQGDTTSVLVGALGACYRGIRVAHLEAGLRSGDMLSPFPEEMNRVLVSRLATYNFTPTRRATESLLAEGVAPQSIHEVGNTVIDALMLGMEILEGADIDPLATLLPDLPKDKRIVLVTGHRRESFGEGFENICQAVGRLAKNNQDVEFIYPVHLNPHVQEPVNRLLTGLANVSLIEPLDYPNLIWLMNRSFFVLTDSGGIQEEAPSLGKPVLVMRDVTERQEGVLAGTAKLVGTDPERIYEQAQLLLTDTVSYEQMANAVNPYGDGTAARQIAAVLRQS